MTAITFTLPGKPFAWRRARSNGAMRFKDADSVRNTDLIRAVALPLFPEPLQGPVKLRVDAIFEVPKSWSAKKRAAALGGWHIQKPDQDNLQKQVKDSLNRIAWADDSQVADARCTKRWGTYSETVVTVEVLA